MALPYATEGQLKILEQKTKADLDRKTANINLTANTLDDMNALIASGTVNDGQLCYLKEDKKLYVLKEGVWSEVGGDGGGGASVSPTLWLFDVNNYTIRTTITEEEYNNLKNGLYNQVMYCSSVNQIDLTAMYNPSKLFAVGSEEDGYQFVFTYFVYNESNEISGLNQCFLNIGEKNANNEYPFTVEVTDTTILSGTIPIYEATYDSTSDKLTLKEAVSGSHNTMFVKYTNNNGNSYTWLYFTKTLNIRDSFGWQCIDYGRNQVHTIIANDTSIETVDQGLGQTTTLFNKEILVPPSSNVAPILPCTTADNGKVLSVVDGEAQWTKIDVNSYPYITGRINASDTQTSSFPKTDSETRVVTIENLDLSKLLNTKTIIVDADADASEVFNIACGAYGETEGIGTYVSSISCDKKTNNLFFFYINVDIQTSSFIIKRKTIPTSTNTITFED